MGTRLIHRFLTPLLLLVWVLAACLPLLAAKVRLWAISDGLRVEPTRGRLLEARPDIHADYPGKGHRARNAVWDAESKTVALKAARNEFVAFQLVIETDAPLKDVDVRFPELRHASGARLAGRNLAVFKAWYVQVRRPSTGYEATSLGAGWYPDALMPKRQSSLFPGFPFDIPDRYNNISDQTNQTIWLDIFVPPDAQQALAGRYRGEVEVTWEGGRNAVNVALDVWDFALPQETHLQGDIWNNSLRRASFEEELQYHHLARRHRFLPLVYAYRPKLSVEGASVRLDWSEYDRRLTPYVDGSAFTAKYGYWGPGYGVPVTHIMLPFNIRSSKGNKGSAWPIPLPKEGRTPEYEAVWKEVGRQIREHLDRSPAWREVDKIAFLNGLDESYYETAYEKMLYYGKLLHEAMGRGWFKYRVDGGYSREAMEQLSNEVDLWVCHTVAFDKETVDYFRPKGVETWFYGPMIYEQKRNSGCGSNTFLDLDLLVNRAIGWIGWKYDAGWVEWEFDWNAYAVWYEAENFKDDHRAYNGSGQLIYRGETMGYREPIASIRLKAQRRGLQDHEYFWLLGQLSGNRAASDKLVNSVIYEQPFGAKAMLDTEIWRNHPDEWDRVRVVAGDKVAALQKQAAAN